MLRLSDEPAASRKLRAALTRVARSCGLSPEAEFELKLAATEALTNAVKRAPAGEAIEVRIATSPEGVDVEVTDRGSFVARHESRLDEEGGRGIPLMLALVDEVEFASVGSGKRVRMRKRAGRPHARGTPALSGL